MPAKLVLSDLKYSMAEIPCTLQKQAHVFKFASGIYAPCFLFRCLFRYLCSVPVAAAVFLQFWTWKDMAEKSHTTERLEMPVLTLYENIQIKKWLHIIEKRVHGKAPVSKRQKERGKVPALLNVPCVRCEFVEVKQQIDFTLPAFRCDEFGQTKSYRCGFFIEGFSSFFIRWESNRYHFWQA